MSDVPPERVALRRGLFVSGATRLRLGPAGILHGEAAAHACGDGRALPLAGLPLAFPLIEVWLRGPAVDRVAIADADGLRAWADGEGCRAEVEAVLDRLTAPRPPFAELTLDRPRIMGVVNVTPDSFSDGGAFADTARAVDHGRRLRDAGADIVDIGGESTRPGALPVPAAEQIGRVIPVIEALAEDGVLVSIDTRSAAVMAAAIDAGARVVNDVSALAGDPEAGPVVARCGAATVLMHMAGEPATMQHDPRYRFAPLDVLDALEARIAAARDHGIAAGNIAVDPGIGFGKRVTHNVALLARAGLLHGLGVAVLAGVSRKGFVGRIAGGAPADARLPGSLAAGLAAAGQGVQILRVHDVAETRQALDMLRAITFGIHPD